MRPNRSLLALRTAAAARSACLGLLLGAALLAAPLAQTQPKPAAEARQPGTPRTITWEVLVPPDWDPFKDFKGLDMQSLDDGDPRAAAMLKRMREIWDQAPVNESLNGQTVRIPGFVVPLEDSTQGLKEFLLVPYFGACIHSPPPPANQILHVLADPPAKGVRSMDTVWITGRLFTERTDSYMGVSGYRIMATTVAPYTDKAR